MAVQRYKLLSLTLAMIVGLTLAAPGAASAAAKNYPASKQHSSSKRNAVPKLQAHYGQRGSYARQATLGTGRAAHGQYDGARPTGGVLYSHRRPPRVAHVEALPLYSDGPGTSFGFHPGPNAGRPYPSRAMISRMRRIDALRETMAIDQLTRGHGYGSPFHAGYYGPGGGPDTGFGRGY